MDSVANWMILKDLILEDGALPFQNQITAIQSLILVENTAKKKKKKVRWEEFGGDQNWGKSKVNIELTSSKVNMNNNISFLKTLDI